MSNLDITYGSWSRGYNETVDIVSKSEAKTSHDNRDLYFAVIGDPSYPDAFIEINDSFLYVGFLDDHQREVKGYEFTEIEPDRIFLKEIQLWEYEGVSDNRTSSVRFRFTTEGAYGVEKADLRTNNVERIEPSDTIDASGLFAEYPTFGAYDELMRDDRIDLSRLPMPQPGE